VSAGPNRYPGDATGWGEPPDAGWEGQQVALVDLLDRLLAGGVVLNGEVTISLAGVDLVHVSLRTLISSAATLLAPPRPPARLDHPRPPATPVDPP
jgi:Gas vesicle protein